MYCRLAILMAEKQPGMSQSQLCRETGLDKVTVNRLFTNKFKRVDTGTVEKLCKYFGRTSIADLFELREE